MSTPPAPQYTQGAENPASSDLLHLDVTCGSGTEEAVTSGEEFVHFDIVNIDNPTNTTSGVDNNTFYARIYDFTGFTPTAFANPAPLGQNEGGVALSTAEQINVSARVQEELTFTVGTDAAADDCASIAGNDIDLGSVDSTNPANFASVDSVTGSDTNVACAEISTNAARGVNLTYIGDNLEVAGGPACGTENDDGGTGSVVDICFNFDDDPDAGTLTGAFAQGREQWGLGVSTVAQNGTTTNISAAGAYDIDTAGEYAFDDNTTTQIASASTVVDQEAVEIDASAMAEITTPTGVYTTTLTFVATAQY